MNDGTCGSAVRRKVDCKGAALGCPLLSLSGEQEGEEKEDIEGSERSSCVHALIPAASETLHRRLSLQGGVSPRY